MVKTNSTVIYEDDMTSILKALGYGKYFIDEEGIINSNKLIDVAHDYFGFSSFLDQDTEEIYFKSGDFSYHNAG